VLDPTVAARVIVGTVRTLPAEDVPLTDALDRILAADVTSPIDLPPWDNSAMDGYAIRSDDVCGRCPVELEIIESVAAGGFPQSVIEPGQCSRIFTGAPIPLGADAVIRQEDASPIDGRRVRIEDDRDVGCNVRTRGEDMPVGSTVLPRGTQLGPAQVGLLASIAYGAVPVHRRPRVAILSSGDEITDLDDRQSILSGTKIASSNSYTMTAMTRHAGGVPVYLGIARDDPVDLRDRLIGTGEADLLVTSGGVSVGEHDHLRKVLQDLGAEIKFWRVRMRPGAPIAFGLLRDLPWIGLPGNPVSAMVTFELFARPAIRVMIGLPQPFRRTVQVCVGEPIEIQSPRRHFMRVRISEIDGQKIASLTGPQGSGILTSMANADALLIVPENRQRVARGEWLNAMLLNEPVHVKDVPF
jgi:molybdopterin molybdotransferase